jgi:hypothetical protein
MRMPPEREPARHTPPVDGPPPEKEGSDSISSRFFGLFSRPVTTGVTQTMSLTNYSRPFDGRGLLSYLGTNCGKDPYENPQVPFKSPTVVDGALFLPVGYGADRICDGCHCPPSPRFHPLLPAPVCPWLSSSSSSSVPLLWQRAGKVVVHSSSQMLGDLSDIVAQVRFLPPI